jgi:hypothetical protein
MTKNLPDHIKKERDRLFLEQSNPMETKGQMEWREGFNGGVRCGFKAAWELAQEQLKEARQVIEYYDGIHNRSWAHDLMNPGKSARKYLEKWHD